MNKGIFNPSEKQDWVKEELSLKEEFIIWFNLFHIHRNLKYAAKAHATLHPGITNNQKWFEGGNDEAQKLESIIVYHRFRLASEVLRKKHGIIKDDDGDIKDIEKVLALLDSDRSVFRSDNFHPTLQSAVLDLLFSFSSDYEWEKLPEIEFGKEVDWKSNLTYVTIAFKTHFTEENRKAIESRFIHHCVLRLTPYCVDLLLKQFWNNFTHDPWGLESKYKGRSEEAKAVKNELEKNYQELFNVFNTSCAMNREMITLPECIKEVSGISARMLSAWKILTDKVSVLDLTWRVAPHYEEHQWFVHNLSNYFYGRTTSEGLVDAFKKTLAESEDAIHPRVSRPVIA